jgi:hypothetical protein
MLLCLNCNCRNGTGSVEYDMLEWIVCPDSAAVGKSGAQLLSWVYWKLPQDGIVGAPFLLISATLWCISVLNIYRYHGTADFTLAYPNLAEEMKEWSNVLGVSWSQNISNTPIAGYTKMVYGDGTKLVGFSALDVGHSVPVRTEDDLVWFGLMPSSSTTSTATSSKASTTLSTSTTTSSASSTSTAAHWGQW